MLCEKMASESRQPAESSKQLLRAKRIPDAAWEVWRGRLVELYLEKEASQKEIVDTMAQEHNFTITYESPCHMLYFLSLH